jgi:hypothetical protein
MEKTMAIPTTLLAYHQDRETQFPQKKAAAEKLLQDIQLVGLPAVRKTIDGLTAKSADLSRQVALLRQGIAQAPTKADQDGLTLKLEKALMDTRSTAAALMEAQREMSALTESQTSQSAAISAFTAAISSAKAAKGTASQREKRIQDTKDIFKKAPLDTLSADITSVLGGVAAADKRIQDDVPAALLTRALERRKVAVQLLADANAAGAAAQALSGSKLQQASAQADAALFAFATQAPTRLEASKTALALVTNPSSAPLTAEEKARLADATLVAAATTALAAEKARDDARMTLNAKQALLDDAILQALNTDIDADLTTVKAVTDATKDRDDAQKAFNKAVAAFTPAMQDDLHRWEAALPDANWDLIHSLEEAKATLSELQASNVGALTASITAAESAWVANLYASEKKERTAGWITAQVKSRAAALEFENNLNRQRRLTALRGDL